MRNGLRLVVGFALASLLLMACGTTLPDHDFNVLGSGKSVVKVTSGPVTGPTSGSAPGASSSPGAVVSQPSQHTGGSGSGVPGTGPTTAASHPAASGSGQHTGSQHPVTPTSTCTGTNTASDTGVTATTIKIGTIYSGQGNPFAPDQFIPNYYGLNAYVDYVNAHGGICGRQLQLVHCDDNGDRNQDISCAHSLIDQDKVFALVANNVYQYAAASYVSQQKVLDIGGEPITGSAYYTYPHLYSINGSLYPNNGTPPANYYGAEGLGKWFKQHLHLTRAAVIYYAQADSERGANFVKGFLTNNGVKVDTESVPLAGDPTPEVQDMKSNGDQAIFDALDISGNQKVCAAMKQYSYNVPKISTISTWTQSIGQAFSGYPCLNNYYSWGYSANYGDTSNPQVATFRKAYATYSPGAPLAQWSLEGWAAGMWFAQSAADCGAKLTRACVETKVNTKKGFTADGLLDPHTVSFPRYTSKPSRITQCDEVVKWGGGSGGTWATAANVNHTCYTTGAFTYQGG